MRVFRTISREQVIQLQPALQRWENEGGAVPRDMRSASLGMGRSSDVTRSESGRPTRPSQMTARWNRIET
jgi:hypothetical protein